MDGVDPAMLAEIDQFYAHNAVTWDELLDSVADKLAGGNDPVIETAEMVLALITTLDPGGVLALCAVGLVRTAQQRGAGK